MQRPVVRGRRSGWALHVILAHLRENLAAAELELSADVLDQLDAIGAAVPA